jgi:hypothetical protein
MTGEQVPLGRGWLFGGVGGGYVKAPFSYASRCSACMQSNSLLGFGQESFEPSGPLGLSHEIEGKKGGAHPTAWRACRTRRPARRESHLGCHGRLRSTGKGGKLGYLEGSEHDRRRNRS